ncbi:MAG: Uma2 family endonuclease, partial [Myxococcota bacterium]
MSQSAHHRFTYAEYLRRERETGLKHEFLDGQVFAMTGGTPEHARLIAALMIAVAPRLKPGCRLFSADLKIRIPETGLATYPDGAVVCGELEHPSDDELAVTNPTVLF